MGWRRRTPWLPRDAVAIALVIVSAAAVLVLLPADAIPRGTRLGVSFLLIFVLIGASGVLMVRHVPATVLQLGGPSVLLVAGGVLAFAEDGPTRFVGVAGAVLGGANLVVRIQRRRRLQRSDSTDPPDPPDH